jgi:hypothetical protein
MSGSKPKLKVRTLDEMFKKISESSENDPEQLAHTSENSPALTLGNRKCKYARFFAHITGKMQIIKDYQLY